MKDDPFARLVGLDQKLFAPQPPSGPSAPVPSDQSEKPAEETPKEGNSERRKVVRKETTKIGTKISSFEGKDGGKKEERDAGSSLRREEGNYGRKKDTTHEETVEERKADRKRRRQAVLQGGKVAGHEAQPPLARQRTTQRRPYELFEDQLLWISRTKVEVLEQYGRRVTGNAMVQLALDLFIQDYREAGRRSHLVTDLVRARPVASRAASEGSFDLYLDQLLWLSRTKVDLLATYGQRVSGNAMVQLALDLFIQDYHEKGRGSALVTKLVFSEPVGERPVEEGEEASDEGEMPLESEGG